MKEQNNENYNSDLIGGENAPETDYDPVSELNDVVFSGGGKRQSERFLEQSKLGDDFVSKTEEAEIENPPEPEFEENTYFAPERVDDDEEIFFTDSDDEKPRDKKPAKNKKGSLKKWQKAILIILLVLLFVVVASVLAVFLMHHFGKKDTMADNYGENFRDTIVYDGVTYHYNPDVTSVAFMGVDRESFGLEDKTVGTGGQSDVNMVVTINTKTGDSNVIFIPRDVYCDIDKYSNDGKYIGTESAQLCIAYSYGDGKVTSCTNTVTSMQRILYGVPINTFVALNLDGIAKLNDCIGGVKLVSPNTYKDFAGGQTYTLHGDEAEAFIRSREHTLEGDTGRRERQIAYVKAYVSQAAKMSLTNPSTLRTIYDTGKDYTVTNLTLSRGLFFGTTILSNPTEVLNFNNVIALKGTLKEDKLHYAQTVLDEKAALETVLDIYYIPEN